MVGKGAQEQRNMGGTFGIGKVAPFVCSELRTVFYNTKNIQNESAFIWKSIFTTHGKPKKEGMVTLVGMTKILMIQLVLRKQNIFPRL